MDIKVDNIKLGKHPAQGEYVRQKREVAMKQCRHLKPLKRITFIDSEHDETIDEFACDCGRVLSPSEFVTREKLLIKFKKKSQ